MLSISPAANGTWFTVTLNGNTDFSVYSFQGHEAVCEAYEFTLELVSDYDNRNFTDYIGKEVCLSIKDKVGAVRLIHGLVREFRQLHTANSHTHYQCVIVPRLWFLTQTTQHRIFQDKSIIEIISQVLTEHGFASNDFAFKCFYDYEPREYCVQYGESDFYFINRLCEEEGLYYYFEHTQNSHCLEFCDREGGLFMDGGHIMRFYAGSGQLSEGTVISRLNASKSVASNSATYREWNFQKPRLNLEVGKIETGYTKAPRPDGMHLETYQYPHLYQLQKTGNRYAEIQLMRQFCCSFQVAGESDTPRFLPGRVFGVESHPHKDVNTQSTNWTILTVTHYGEQPQALEHEAPDRGVSYKCSFTAIPEMTRFIPELKHPKVLIHGKQTAIVTGPPGEEIYPDKYGRVKVQFFWDRLDQYSDKSSCWVRVSQGWSGSQYGTMSIPRIGHEVIVSFLEGNPDRPIITGRVYHELNRPAYELPENKTRTVFKSMSTPGSGDAFEKRGFNELRIEDKRTQEEIYTHAEKDLNRHIKNDQKAHVLHDRHSTVNNFSHTLTKGEEHVIVEQARKTELLTENHLTVRGKQHTSIGNNWLVKADDEIHLESLMKAVLEAGADLTLKVGPSFVRMVGGDIYISGPTVRINSGGEAGDGTPAVPLLPGDGVVPEVPAGPSVGCLRTAAIKASGMCKIHE